MAIKTTPSTFKGFTFDGESSKTYGVYITGEGVYDAPSRDVEMISIPGRNGSYALDKGRFNNIQVTYDAAIIAESESDFVDAISNLRNFLCSKTTYCRLTDEYNPSEYRMAIYKDGLDISPTLCQRGEFSITFECKPQRFLTSGEQKTTLTSGDTITNPTRFDARPMLEVTGYGDIKINNDTVTVNHFPIGKIALASTYQLVQKSVNLYEYNQIINDPSLFANGDTITMAGSRLDLSLADKSPYYVTDISAQPVGGSGFANVTSQVSSGKTTISITQSDYTFTAGTASTKTASTTWEVLYEYPPTNMNVTITLTLAYDGNDTFNYQYAVSFSDPVFNQLITSVWINELSVNSSLSSLGNPLYFDLDIGEAYKLESNTYVSVNSSVEIPPELPVLKPGSNTITFDNTVTKLDIIPRWWIV